jgi:hypothetical protein
MTTMLAVTWDPVDRREQVMLDTLFVYSTYGKSSQSLSLRAILAAGS